MIKKMLKSKIVIIILTLVVLYNIGFDLRYYCKNYKIEIEVRKNNTSEAIKRLNEILQAREDFLTKKAKKGNKLKYVSKWERDIIKQFNPKFKFDPKIHCEIPDDIKVMYDKMLGKTYTLINWWNWGENSTEIKKLVMYTYDRRSSRITHIQDNMYEAPANLWSKQYLKFAGVQVGDGSCKELEKKHREYLIKEITEGIESYEEYYKKLEDYEKKWKINILNPFLKIPDYYKYDSDNKRLPIGYKYSTIAIMERMENKIRDDLYWAYFKKNLKRLPLHSYFSLHR